MTEKDFRKESYKVPTIPFKTDGNLFQDMLDEIDRLRKEILELKRSLEYHCQLEQYGEFRGFPEEIEGSD